MAPRGRPQNPEQQEQTRNALKQAAKDLLCERSYRSITLRTLAERAGTQSAMVSYYFGSKEELFAELLRDVGDERMEVFVDISRVAEQQPEKAIDLIIDSMLEHTIQELWLFRLLQDDVLTQESRLRNDMIKMGPIRLGGYLAQMLEEMKAKGLLKPELNPQFAAVTILSNLIAPILLEPIFNEGFQLDMNRIGSEEWKSHVKTILNNSLINADS